MFTMHFMVWLPVACTQCFSKLVLGTGHGCFCKVLIKDGHLIWSISKYSLDQFGPQHGRNVFYFSTLYYYDIIVCILYPYLEFAATGQAILPLPLPSWCQTHLPPGSAASCSAVRNTPDTAGCPHTSSRPSDHPSRVAGLTFCGTLCNPADDDTC